MESTYLSHGQVTRGQNYPLYDKVMRKCTLTMIKAGKTRILLSIIVFALLLLTYAYSLEIKSLLIDAGFTIGAKGTDIVLAFKYAFANEIAFELFGTMVPAEITVFGFGSEVNYYPELLHYYGYVNFGISMLSVFVLDCKAELIRRSEGA